MHLVRNTIGGDTLYVVFDFKQKFISKGFREGGDAYYGKKRYAVVWCSSIYKSTSIIIVVDTPA